MSLITRVKYNLVKSNNEDSKLLAICKVTIGDVLMLHNIKLYKGGIVVMPQDNSISKESGYKRDIFHPITKGFFKELKDEINYGYSVAVATGDDIYFPDK